MIKHDLVEQVGGIERAREIVEGAPEWAKHWITRNEYHMSVISFPNMADQKSYLIDDLRTAIAEHDEDHCEHEWGDLTSNGDKYRSLVCKHCDSTQNYLPLDDSREFKVGDLVVKTHPKNTILWPVLGVYKNGGVWLDYKGFCWKPPRIRHATPAEIAVGHRLEAERHG